MKLPSSPLNVPSNVLSNSHSTFGFSLVEVTLALGVAAFCLLSILGLLSVSLTNNRNAIEQTAASRVAAAIVADLRATKTSVPAAGKSPLFQIPIPGTGTATHTLFLREDGSAAGLPDIDADPSQNPQYRATIVFTAPGSATQKFATMARIALTWPAMADRAAAAAPVHYSGFFEVMAAIDRN